MPTILQGIGLEELLDIVEMTLRGKLNDALDRQAEIWVSKDQARAVARGIEYVEIALPHVSNDGFHVFNIPSMVRDEVPPEEYPYVAIVPDDNAPDAEDARNDHLNVRQNMLSIHALAMAAPDEPVEFAGRRATRMAEAIYATVLGDPRLGRMLSGVSNPLRVRVSEPFVFENSEGIETAAQVGDRFWQAAGTQYAVKNYSQNPEEV